MTSQSIKQPCPCILTTLFCAFIVFVSLKHVAAYQNDKKYKKLEILDDLPLKTDFNTYLIALDNIVNFANTYKRYVDMNFSFGLFLINVNLKTISIIKGIKLVPYEKDRLNKILKTNDYLMDYFRLMVQKYIDKTGSTGPERYISESFSDGETTWSNHLQKFRHDLLKTTKFYSKRELKDIYGTWPKYIEKVYDFESYVPNPAFSDSCISLLAREPVNYNMQWVNCKITRSCIEFVLNGTNFGYGITHRLLYMIIARYSKGCSVISGSQDKHNIDKYCSKMYNEAEYLSYHNFEIPDLSMEQMALCSLEGHVQFIRRSWIDELLDFQNVVGCFGNSAEDKNKTPPLVIYDTERPKWEIVHEDQEIMGGVCNTHASAVAAGMLSAAIRYILEKYY